MLNKIIKFFLSLKLTVTLLSLSMVLVFAGTLAQVDQGIWTVMDQYFRCYVALIELPIFFPHAWNVPNLKIPFPGGFLLGVLLTMNLVAVQAKNFRILAEGRRKIIGIGILLFGALVVVGVMFGWGTAPVASTENDAFWRVFFRLGRGTVAALVLYAASVLLYRKRAGMVLMHSGIIFLLVGEFITALFAVESSMTIEGGETVNFMDHSQQFELAFTETSNPDHDTVTVIPSHLLKDGELIQTEALPFDVRVIRFMTNSNQPQPLQAIPSTLRQRYPIYKGPGARWYVAEQREVSGTSAGGRNAHAVDVELIHPQTGTVYGRYILPLWFYPNFVRRQLDLPTRFGIGDREYTVYLRNKREYTKTSDGKPYSVKLLEFVHEKYEGTQMAKDYASRIQLVNEGDKIDRELRIWMNNPLRYARRTFYQSSFLPDDRGTVLQVVRNDTWMIPYLSCMIVFVGMTAQFLQSLGRYLRREKNAEEGGQA